MHLGFASSLRTPFTTFGDAPLPSRTVNGMRIDDYNLELEKKGSGETHKT